MSYRPLNDDEVYEHFARVARPPSRSPGHLTGDIFRAFLIDDEGLIRNIYSLEFFQPKLVLNDVHSLLMERGASPGAAAEDPPD